MNANFALLGRRHSSWLTPIVIPLLKKEGGREGGKKKKKKKKKEEGRRERGRKVSFPFLPF